MKASPTPMPAREVENPRVVGRANFRNVTEYLDQEIVFSSLFPALDKTRAEAAFDPVADVDADLLLGVPVEEDM